MIPKCQDPCVWNLQGKEVSEPDDFVEIGVLTRASCKPIPKSRLPVFGYCCPCPVRICSKAWDSDDAAGVVNNIFFLWGGSNRGGSLEVGVFIRTVGIPLLQLHGFVVVPRLASAVSQQESNYPKLALTL